MTDLNPLLLSSFNLMQGGSVQNSQLPSQQTDFTKILAGLFGGTSDGTEQGIANGLPALRKLVNLLSKDDGKTLPDTGVAWQQLPHQGNNLPSLNWLNYLQQLDAGTATTATNATTASTDGASTEITQGAASVPGAIVIPAALLASGRLAVKSNQTPVSVSTDATTTTESGGLQDWLSKLTQQQLDLLKSTLNVQNKGAENPAVQSPTSDNLLKSMNEFLQQAMNKLQLSDQTQKTEASGLPGLRLGDNINPVQASLLSSQQEFKNFLKSSGSSVPETALKLAGKIGSDSIGPNFHTGLESQIKVGADAILHKADAQTSLTMQHTLGKPEWATELGDKVTWLGKQDIKSAMLRLNPANLGPVEVRISVHNDQTNVSFIAHHPQARDALEGSIPRLREMMDSSGFNLGNVDVSGRSPQGQQGQASAFAQQQQQQSHGHASYFQADSDDLPPLETLTQTITRVGSNNSVDYFA